MKLTKYEEMKWKNLKNIEIIDIKKIIDRI